MRLFVVQNNREQLVSWPSDLIGNVSIHNSEQALQFLRIFSSQHTWYRFPEYGYLEIGVSSSNQNCDIAPVSPAVFRSLGLRSAEVKELDGEFRIRRSVVKPDGDKVLVIILDETVSPNGRYIVRRSWEHAMPMGELGLSLPEFM
jgi:hypothetical protein